MHPSQFATVATLGTGLSGIGVLTANSFWPTPKMDRHKQGQNGTFGGKKTVLPKPPPVSLAQIFLGATGLKDFFIHVRLVSHVRSHRLLFTLVCDEPEDIGLFGLLGRCSQS